MKKILDKAIWSKNSLEYSYVLIIYLVFRSEKNIKLLQLLESTIHSQCKYPLS